ncbi:hypothetical protein PR202_gn00006 [Eleusine coracana subsp. coracana]|uniref:Nodulation protein H n=1 Tax=Eleusine coracana subsp. coracana TaxID=191504 RepID=A0AAV5G0L6_ELECO|nr:hypothetical protein PR202_gn00006 [Eleusine coracana subsp. coracana]
MVAICLQGAFDLKAPKKSPIALRMVVLAVTILCGVFICSMCMKQLGSESWSRIVKIEVAAQPCNKSTVPPSEVPFVHYPQPITYNRDECMCNPVRFFTIISSQRSGSGWFETLLNSHINISSNGEIFSNKERRSNISSIVKTLDKVYNLDWNSSASKNECTAAIGFKWMLNQANILAKYKPRLNTTSLISNLKQADEYTRDALRNLKSIRHITIYYEDLISNRTRLLDVLDFLKVPRRKLVSRHVKIHTRPLSEQIENWDEVYNALNGTQYESFLNADYRI